jgi:FkbM family methyltransferase
MPQFSTIKLLTKKIQEFGGNNFMIIRTLAQFIIDSYLNSKPETLGGKVKEKIFSLIRKNIIRYADPEVRFNLAGKNITIPFSHDLPFCKKKFPVYADNIGRLAVLLKKKYETLRMIDIGANVGDTAVLVKNKVDIPILCIEGEKKYYSLLQRNLEGFKDVYVEKSFIGDKNFIKGNYIYSKGSGRFAEQEGVSGIFFLTLENTILKYSQFKKSKLLKIDTDGFDCRIIRSEINLLAQMKPVVFFEYDPFLLSELNDDGLSVFNSLLEAGYNKIIFYTNTGEYLLSTQLKNRGIIKDLHYFYSGRSMDSYSDIVVFHNEDDDLAQDLINAEHKYFALYRNFGI